MKLSFIKTFIDVALFEKKSRKQKDKYVQKALNKLVRFAKKNSEYYAEILADTDTDGDVSLDGIPPLTKEILGKNYDRIVTDKAVHSSALKEFTDDTSDLNRKYLGKYMAALTSGSTGGSAQVLSDDRAQQVFSSVYTLRNIESAEIRKKINSCGRPIVSLCGDSAFSLTNESIRQNAAGLKDPCKRVRIVNAVLPTDEIVRQLNEIKPSGINVYPSLLMVLCEEAEAGRLNIAPYIIVTGGELLIDVERNRAKKIFGCDVHQNYACTEGGMIAHECAHNRLHINEDCVIMEPVYSDGTPTPPGKMSDKVYMTVLNNYIQPMIRYELTDKIILHTESCECGCNSPWVEIIGRSADTVKFKKNGKSVSIASFSIFYLFCESRLIKKFQLIVHPKNRIDFRLIPAEGYTVEGIFPELKAALVDYLSSQGIAAEVEYSPTPPAINPKTLKFKFIEQWDE